MKTEIWKGHKIRFVEKDGEQLQYELDSDDNITLESFLTNLPALTDGKYHDVTRTISKEGFVKSFGAFVLTTNGIYHKTMWSEITGIATKHPFPVLAKVESAYEKLIGEKILPNIFQLEPGGSEIFKNLTRLFHFEELETHSKDVETEERNSGVYLIKGVGTDMYKIGCTTNIEERLKTLQIGSPVSLELVAFFPTKLHTILESRLHRMYEADRKHGEWFSFTEEEVEKLIRAVELMTVRDKYGLDISVSAVLNK